MRPDLPEGTRWTQHSMPSSTPHPNPSQLPPHYRHLAQHPYHAKIQARLHSKLLKQGYYHQHNHPSASAENFEPTFSRRPLYHFPPSLPSSASSSASPFLPYRHSHKFSMGTRGLATPSGNTPEHHAHMHRAIRRQRRLRGFLIVGLIAGGAVWYASTHREEARQRREDWREYREGRKAERRAGREQGRVLGEVTGEEGRGGSETGTGSGSGTGGLSRNMSSVSGVEEQAQGGLAMKTEIDSLPSYFQSLGLTTGGSGRK